MKERDTVSEKAGVLYAKMYPIAETHAGTVSALLFGLNNERDTIERLMTKLTTSGAKFTLSTELDRIDQLIEKLKTL